MKHRAVLVERARGEAVRRALVEAGALVPDLEITEEPGRLVLPVRDDAALRPGWGEEVVREFAPRRLPSSAEFRDLLDWSPAEKELLPRSFDIVGEVVLVRLPPELEARRAEVGDALLRFVPGCRLVGLDRGVVGVERLRSVERIAGSGGWTTRHRENRLEFDVDVERAYFSPRLAGEHAAFAASVRAGELVYDLCCGVGPFAVTAAREGRARGIVAVDANGEAVALLRTTLGRYPFGRAVTPVTGTVEAFAAAAPPAERIVLNLPREGIKYASLVAPLVAPGGSLQFYDVVPRDEVERRGTVVERALASVAPFSVRSLRRVHPYSPSRDLVAVVAEREDR